MKYPHGPRLVIPCTQEVITRAIANDSTRCWIAESIKAAVPTATNVAVDIQTIRFSDLAKGFRYVYLTPYTAQKALLDFDEGKALAPFSFVLKGAHVTRAGTPARVKALHARKSQEARARQTSRAKAELASLVGAAKIGRDKPQQGATPHRVGGRRPPQLRMIRHFGVRAFRGASRRKLEAEAALRGQLEQQMTS